MSLDYQHSQLIELAMHPSSRRRKKNRPRRLASSDISIFCQISQHCLSLSIKTLIIVCRNTSSLSDPSALYARFFHCDRRQYRLQSHEATTQRYYGWLRRLFYATLVLGNLNRLLWAETETWTESFSWFKGELWAQAANWPSLRF